MRKLSSEDLLHWIEETEENELLNTIGAELRAAGEVNKAQLEEMIRWKFASDARRRYRNLDLVRKMDDSLIRHVTRAALSLPESQDLYKIKILQCLDGVGTAMASVILTFYAPNRYGVLDTRVWNQLFPGEVQYTPEKYIELLTALRRLAEKTGQSVRTVEFALWTRDKNLA